MQKESACRKIKKSELFQFSNVVEPLLREVSWQSTLAGASEVSSNPAISAVARGSTATEAKLSTIQALMDANSHHSMLLDAGIHLAISAVRDGLLIGSYVATEYEKATGLDVLQQESRMPDARRVEFRKKNTVSSLIVAFVAASYVVYELSKFKSNELSSMQMEFPGIPELNTLSQGHVRKCLMFYYVATLSKSGQVRNELDLVKMTLLYFEGTMKEVEKRIEGLDYLEQFTRETYKLEEGDFKIDGFVHGERHVQVSANFNPLRAREIVGNVVSKHETMRIVHILCSYDPETQRNPFQEFGGFPSVTLTSGYPGTGKTMEQRMCNTEVYELGNEIGLKVLIWPFPENPISTYQGGTTERLMTWAQPFYDPSHIIVCNIDDAENALVNREKEGVSSGQIEATNFMLKLTEGANAPPFGNSVIRTYTNIPEVLDPAYLSRVHVKSFMDGATRYEDMLDQSMLDLILKFKDIAPEFVDITLTDASGSDQYDYFSAQKIADQIQKEYADRRNSKVEKVADLLKEVQQQYGMNSHEFFGRLYHEFQSQFPQFRSRDMRNIHKAVSNRFTNVNFPSVWFDNMETFFRKTYDEKVAMLNELMLSNLAGKKLSEIWLEEFVNYADNLVQIVDRDFEKSVNAIIKREKEHREALRRLGK